MRRFLKKHDSKLKYVLAFGLFVAYLPGFILAIFNVNVFNLLAFGVALLLAPILAIKYFDRVSNRLDLILRRKRCKHIV